MIEKILSKIREKRDKYADLASSSNFDGWTKEEAEYLAKEEAFDEAISIVQEVAKEYGEKPKEPSRCDTCDNFADENIVPPICYLCCKGLEDNYKAKERKQYCSTCRHYESNTNSCSNGYSQYWRFIRCFDDVCEHWEQKGE